MRFSVRLHDAVDMDTVLRRLLPLLAGERGDRRATFAALDPSLRMLTRRWTTTPGGEVEEADLDLAPSLVNSLLETDAAGDRALRPADSASPWVLEALFPGLEPAKSWVRARAVAHEGRWLGVLAIADPRRWWLPKGNDDSVLAGGDVLELCLGRALVLRERAAVAAASSIEFTAEVPPSEAEPLPSYLSVDDTEALAVADRAAEEAVAALRSRLGKMEDATASATEMLMEAHVELDRRTSRLRRQARLMYLLRRLLQRNAEGIAPHDLAQEIVRTVSEAFEGRRCSVLLLDGAEGAEELRLGAAVGLPPRVSDADVRVPLDSGISGHVVRTSSAVVARDHDEAATHPLIRDELYTGDAFVSLPLCCRGQVLGVLNLTNFREGTIDDTELEQLRLVTLCVGLLIDHARLTERLFAAEGR